MHFIYRPLIAIFATIYGCLWFGVEYDDVKKMFTQKDFGRGLSDDIFEQCKLESAPIWNLNLKKWLNPDHDPFKECNRSYVPWTALRSDGRVMMTSAWDGKSKCRARAVGFGLPVEYRYKMGDWHDIEEQFVFENDIVEVICTHRNISIYDMLHYQIWTGKPKPTTRKKRQAVNAQERPPSVHIIVLDSIGATQGRRNFEKTTSYMKKEFGAVEILHMNKVGENSRPNGMAFLFGKMVVNLNRGLFGLPPRKADWNRTIICNSYLDDRGFILKEFEEIGYKTMMAEDWAKGVFNWPGCKGFERPATTHYMRPFQLRQSNKDPVMRETMTGKRCFEAHLHLNGYHEKFIEAYPDEPKAVMTWASYLGHDSPHDSFHTDKHYKQMMQRHKEEFDNSFVFFMGDHGLRFGWYSRDPVGRRDINNPMLWISVPRKMRNDTVLMDNLRRNARQLLTHFDTHATFMDIVKTFSTKNPVLNFSQQTTINHPKHPDHLASFPPNMFQMILKYTGSSLFRPLPPTPRNCKSLPIPPQYCLCEITREKLNITDAHDGIGAAIADVINERIAEANASDVCATLEMEELQTVQQMVGATNLYDVIVKLRPGGGIFKTYVRGSGDDYEVVVPDVTRLNAYGRAADCTTINEIRQDFNPICYCKSNLRPSKSLVTSTPVAKEASPVQTKTSSSPPPPEN